LGQGELEFCGVKAHAGGAADEPFMATLIMSGKLNDIDPQA